MYIGRSQFGVDPDFCGAISDFRIYENALNDQDIIQLMCNSLTDEQIIKLAKDKYLPTPDKIINTDIDLPKTLINGKVNVEWSCDKADLINSDGKVTPSAEAAGVVITAKLSCGELTDCKTFKATVLPKDIAPYELTVHGDKEVLDISKTLYGLFYEDINNAADGGIYAEMIQNRSFEAFEYDTYDVRSGENGISTGRNHTPLRFWFGDTDKVAVKNQGGLNEHFNLEDADTNAYYVEVEANTTLYNRGYCDNTHKLSMNLKEGNEYYFTVWGYMMTMGLGYMEYFQLSEDLNAEPLPVMACGVLCQARSDYANPAGGKLQKKYIDNFIDLIDFAISTDFENNKWAALRKEMGHEAPFGLQNT